MGGGSRPLVALANHLCRDTQSAVDPGFLTQGGVTAATSSGWRKTSGVPELGEDGGFHLQNPSLAGGQTWLTSGVPGLAYK